MAHFELNLSDNAAHTGGVLDVQLHGLAIKIDEETGHGRLAHRVVHCADFIRTIVDTSQLAAYMETNLASDGVTGPLVAMWATQLHAPKSETTTDAYRQPKQLQRVGAWFLPTAEATASDRVPVAIEHVTPGSSHMATAQRLGEDGRVARFERPVFGITLPRTPEMQARAEVFEAVLLASVPGENVYGLLHRVNGDATSIEQVIPPAEATQRLRPSVGAMILNISKPY